MFSAIKWYVVGMLLAASPAFAKFNYEGYLTDTNGQPLAAQSVMVKLQLRSPGTEDCLLFEEVHTITTRTDGYFSVFVGAGTRLDSGTATLARLFENRGSLTGLTCTTGTSYSPASTDARSLAVYVSGDTGSTYDSLGSISLDAAPRASVAGSVEGFTPNTLMRVVDNSGNPAAAPTFSSANASELMQLILGTSTQYLKAGTTTNGAVLPTFSATPSSPTVGSIWYDSTANAVKYYNGTATQTVAAGGSGLSSITLSSNLTGNGTPGATLNAPGTIDLANTVTAGTATKVTYDAKGRITSATTPTTLAGYGILDAVQGSGVNQIQAGVSSGKGTAGTAGRVFLATDTQQIFRDSGSSWDLIAGAGGSGGEINTASNQGTAGVGVYDSKVGFDLRFRNISNTDGKVDINLDTPNKNIILGINEANLDHANIGGTVSVTHGGTNSTTALTNNKLMISQGGAIVESPALSISSGGLTVNGGSDVKQLVAKGYSTQTANIFEVQDYASATKFGVTSAGNTTVGGSFTTIGNTSLGGTLNVTGNSNLGSSLTVTGQTTTGGLISTGPAMIQGSSDAVQMIVKGASTQTNNVLEVKNNSSVIKYNIRGDYLVSDSTSIASKAYVDTAVSSGTAGTALALSANPIDCASNTFATSIAANGDLTCAGINLATDTLGVLPVNRGGTGTSTTLSNNRIMVSSSGSIVENPALQVNTGGMAIIGSIDSRELLIKGASGQTANLMEFQNYSGSNLVVVSSAGNLGIGTTTPTAALDVSGPVTLGTGSASIALGGPSTVPFKQVTSASINTSSTAPGFSVTSPLSYGSTVQGTTSLSGLPTGFSSAMTGDNVICSPASGAGSIGQNLTWSCFISGTNLVINMACGSTPATSCTLPTQWRVTLIRW